MGGGGYFHMTGCATTHPDCMDKKNNTTLTLWAFSYFVCVLARKVAWALSGCMNVSLMSVHG